MSHVRLPAETHIGYAHLQVAKLERSLAFYEGLVGFKVVQRGEGSAALSADGLTPHLLLTERPDARPKPARTTGLYHVAIRLPNRRALSQVFRRLVEHGWPFQGAADHLVSEALYLADPDGSGLELYRDRPRENWPRQGDQVAMTSDPLDLNALLDETAGDKTAWSGIDPATDIGHIHLHVADLGRAKAFYVDVLGFDVMQDNYPGALFVAAGGYHHHLGLNIWAGKGAPPPPPDAVGLLSFSLVLPTPDALEAVTQRVKDAGLQVEHRGEAHLLVRDPSGSAIELTVQ